MLGSIIGAVGQIGSAIGGAIASSKANREAQKELDSRKEENETWYDRKMAEDYTSRSDVQASLTKQKELLQENLKNARATNAVAGGTAESEALAKKSATQATADATATIASNASDYKNEVESQYRKTAADLSEKQEEIYRNQAQTVADAASQAGDAFSKFGQAVG